MDQGRGGNHNSATPSNISITLYTAEVFSADEKTGGRLCPTRPWVDVYTWQRDREGLN
jgi:hypothetical protein